MGKKLVAEITTSPQGGRVEGLDMGPEIEVPGLITDEEVAPPIALGQIVSASRRNLTINTIASYFPSVISLATGLIVTPLLLLKLGSEQFGFWILLVNLAGYAGLLELGMSSATAKRVAECSATGDPQRLRTVLGTSRLVYVFSACISMILLSALAAFTATFFHAAPPLRRQVNLCMLILAANQSVSLLLAFRQAVLSGSGQLYKSQSILSGMMILTAIANIIVAWRGGGLVGLSIVALSSTLIGGILITRHAGKHLGPLKLGLSAFDLAMARQMLKFGSRNALISALGATAYGSDTVVIGALLPASQLAVYGVASRLVNFPVAFALRLMNALPTAYAELESLRLRSRQFKVFQHAAILSTLLFLPFAASIIAFGGRIITAWVGAGHTESASVAAVIAATSLLLIPAYNALVLLIATEKTSGVIFLYLAIAPVNLLLSIILTRHLGTIGTAIGSLITAAVADFVVLPYMACRIFEFSIFAYVAGLFKALLIPICVAIASAAVVARFGPSGGRVTVALCLGSVVGLTYLAFVAELARRGGREAAAAWLRELKAVRGR